jgi:hypothetical protein
MSYHLTLQTKILAEILMLTRQKYTKILSLDIKLATANLNLKTVQMMIAPEMAAEGEIIDLLFDANSLINDVYTKLLFSSKTPPGYISSLSSKLCTEDKIEDINENNYQSIKIVSNLISSNYNQLIKIIETTIKIECRNIYKQIHEAMKINHLREDDAWKKTKHLHFYKTRKITQQDRVTQNNDPLRYYRK